MDAIPRPMRAVIYARTSTADQNSELQLREIQDHATRQGWQIVETYQGRGQRSQGLAVFRQRDLRHQGEEGSGDRFREFVELA